MIPIIILAKERPRQLVEMIDSIEAVTDPHLFRIIICDNDSIDKSAYKQIKHQVIYNERNMLFRGFNLGLEQIKENDDFFVLSDPDIRLNKNMPKDWPIKMINCLKELNIPKIGLALNVNFLVNNKITEKIKLFEAPWWEQEIKIKSISDPCYAAAIDTTFAMYRRDTFKYWINQKKLSFDKGLDGRRHLSQQMYNPKYNLLHKGDDTTKVVRIAGRFTADHLGWDLNNYFDEMKFYSTACNANISSTAKLYRDFL